MGLFRIRKQNFKWNITWLRISTSRRPKNLLFYKRDRRFELAGVPRTKLAGSQEERGGGEGEGFELETPD